MRYYQSREKIRAFFQEFPFLADVSREAKTSLVQVKRVSLEMMDANDCTHVFDKNGELMLVVSSLKEDLLRMESVDRARIGHVVSIRRISPSYWGYGLIDWLFGNWAYYIVVYKAPKDFDLADLPTALAQKAVSEVREEIEKA